MKSKKYGKILAALLCAGLLAGWHAPPVFAATVTVEPSTSTDEGHTHTASVTLTGEDVVGALNGTTAQPATFTLNNTTIGEITYGSNGKVQSINGDNGIIFDENGHVSKITLSIANVVYGNGAKAGELSAAFGTNAEANGTESTAIGYDAEISGNYSTAIGHGTRGYAHNYATAIGHGAKVNNNYATAIGAEAYAVHTNSVAIGYGSQTSQWGTVSFGNLGTSGANYRNLEGIKDVYVSGGIKFTVGGVGNNAALKQGEMQGVTNINDNITFNATNGKVQSINSYKVGNGTGQGITFYDDGKVKSINSYVEGIVFDTNGRVSKINLSGTETAYGNGASATTYSAAYGSGASAQGANSTALGARSKAAQTDSVAIGYGAETTTSNAVSFGHLNKPSNKYGSAYRSLEGIEDIYVNGGIIFTEKGASSYAQLKQGEMQGVTNINDNIIFDANGRVTSINGANGINAIVFDGNGRVSKITLDTENVVYGNSATAGEESAAFGSNATAGARSAAFGRRADASGTGSTAFGTDTEASGMYSAAFGTYSKAIGAHSVAIGYGTQTTDSNTVSFGHLNKPTYKYGPAYRHLEGIEDMYVNGGIIFTSEGAESAANLAQGEMQGVTKINGIGYVGNTIGTAPDAATGTGGYVGSINGSVVFDEDGNVTTINGMEFSNIITANDINSITFYSDEKGYVKDINSGSIAFDENGKVTDIKFAGATGEGSTAYGNGAKAEGTYSTALGTNAEAKGEGSTAIGYGAKANHNYATVIGNGAEVSTNYSTALGYKAYAVGVNSVAIGYGSQTSQWGTVSFGDLGVNKITGATDYRNLEGIKDVYVSGGINFTKGGVGNNEALEQGEMLGVTSINGIGYDGNTIGTAPDAATGTGGYVGSINGSVVFDKDGNVTSINGTDFKDLVNADLSGIENSITGLQTNVSDIESNITTIEGSVDTINTNIGTINSNITSIQKDITNLEDTVKNLDLSVDGEDINPNSVTVGSTADGGTQTVIDNTGATFTSDAGTTTINGGGVTTTTVSATDVKATNVTATTVTTGQTTVNNAGISIADKTVITDSDVVINKGTAGQVSLADVGQRMTVAENRIDRLGKEVDEVGALGAALAGLHPMDTNSRTDIAVALGSYDGNQAVALGAFYRPDKRTMLSLGASATDSRQMFNMGVSFALDRLPEKPAADSEVLAAVMARLEKLEAENAQLRAQYAELKEQTAQEAE